MCGLAGILRYRSRRPIGSPEIEQMTQILAHRGPDGSGVFLDRHFGMGHRRLSIIDTSSRAAQPMETEDGSLTIAFNGEIYNYIELREALIARGVTFRTSSDTEVLLELFRAEGPECLAKLNGMFAIAIWDKRKSSLFLARDHIGIKPLYIAHHAEGLTFGSEIKALLLDPNVARRPNTNVLDAYLRFGYVPGEQTMFDGVTRLLPGHYMLIENETPTVRRYWDVTYQEPGTRSEADLIDEAEQLCLDAVRLQLRSDVPLGVFLSGGLDSSAIVALTHAHGVRNINTYSVNWDHGRDFDESQYARQVSKQFGTQHHEHWMTAADFQDSLQSFTWLMDEPVTEAAAISLLKIAKLARNDVTVVLSGEGSDEVFGGYPIYLFFQLLETYKKLPARVRSSLTDPLLSMLGNIPRKYVGLSKRNLRDAYMGVSFYDSAATYSMVTDDARANIKASPVSELTAPYFSATEGQHLQRRMQYLDMKTWLVDDLLIKADRMTMGASVELRVPFLDYRLVEFSARLPWKLRVRNFQPKYLMKKTMQRYLPREIIYRKKRGFPMPLVNLFRNEMYGLLSDTLTSRQFRERGIFDVGAVNSLLDAHRAGAADNHKSLWQILVLENWYRTFIDPVALRPNMDEGA